MRWIATNAGHEGSIVVQKVREMKDEEGFNALTDTYENLVQGRRHRSGEGRALGAAELLVDRVAPPHDRGARLGDSGGEEGSAGMPGGGRHGRNVLNDWKLELRNSEVEEFGKRPGELSRLAGPVLIVIGTASACRASAVVGLERLS